MTAIIPSCTTAVSTVPEWLREAFKGKEDIASSSKGWSPGALNLSQGIAMAVHNPLTHAEVTRLLIDVSKHPDDDARWSDISRTLTSDQRRRLDERQKQGFLNALSDRISLPLRRRETTVHLAIDTADLQGAAVELACDGRLSNELAWIDRWVAALRERLPDGTVRTGTTPSRDFHSYLRDRHPGLLSIRLTASSSCFLEGQPVKWMDLRKHLIATIPKD